ncbi:hypothetical protein AAV98_10890 [Bacillus sp. CHD6a]|nr:hypothetical protein AAV98_10890 [Bacillus sp. CHD6a]
MKWQSSAPKSINEMLKSIRGIGQKGICFVRMLDKDILYMNLNDKSFYFTYINRNFKKMMTSYLI